MRLLLALSALMCVGVTLGNITGTNPANGSCLCMTGNGVNVRATACGTVIGSGNSGNCFTYQGNKQACTLSGVNYEFFRVRYGSGDGWIAGDFLQVGQASQCGSSGSTRRCICGAPSAGGSVNVRSCASTTCAVLGQINPGECHDHIANSGEWYQINFRGNTNAYSHRDYLSAPHTCGGGSTGLCTANLCSSFSTNQKRACDPQGCGNYGASRGTRAHAGWDVRCNGGAIVYAPYAGTVTRRAYPYGNGSCCDIGFEIVGTGSWAGHSVMIFYCDPNRISVPSSVTRGQAVATHRGLHCGCYSTSMTDHIHYQLSYNGVTIDPASYIFC